MVGNRNDTDLVRTLDPETLQLILEWAGIRLMALPAGHPGPKDLKCFWPMEYNTDKHQILEFRAKPINRAPTPIKTDIPIMEEILLLPNLCSFIDRRKILHARLLKHPIKNTHINSWTKISKGLNTNVNRVKELHRMGLNEVARRAPNEIVWRITNYLADFA